MARDREHLPLIYQTLGEPATELAWRPAADIYRTPDGWLLKFELAGVEPEDVSIHVQGCTLTISGVRRDRLADGELRHYSMEISYSRFHRSIQLPSPIDGGSLDVKFHNGILLVRVKNQQEGK